jgi:PAS domain S-box-containing protein
LEAIGREQAFLRQVLDINPNLIFAKDRQGRFTLVNQAVADMYGTTVEELIGKTDADFNPNADEVAFFRRMDLEVMDSLQERIIPEEVITDAKGSLHYLQTVKRPIIGPDGVANQVLGVATDITERKRLEEQLQQSQKLEALGLLAGGIAHDFNNLLAVIFGNAELMLQRLRQEPEPNPRHLTGLELIITAARRAESLTRQLLAFGRRQKMRPTVLSLNPMLAEAENLLRGVVGERVHLQLHLQDDLYAVRADPGQIEQIVWNLVLNARDAMSEGGSLTVETVNVVLDDAYVNKHPQAKPGRHVRLSVIDDGVGMSNETMSRIFEPFFTTKPLGRGTGLGLSTVYGIVQQAGGHIVVESQERKGTRMTVYLPATDQPMPLLDTGPAVGANLRGNETVLVCEDEENVLRLACEILEGAGYRVLGARSGIKALQVALDNPEPIHLLLTDVVMPEMNGRQLAEALRAKRPETKVLYMTGYSSDVLESEKLNDEVHLIGKPFSPNHLLICVRDALDT